MPGLSGHAVAPTFAAVPFVTQIRAVMKKNVIFFLFLGIGSQMMAQSNLNLGLGYSSQGVTNPGIVVEIEMERMKSADFSLPLKANLGFTTTPDYNSIWLDVHTGFRKYASNGLFWEQYFGIGLMSNHYTVDGIFYFDEFGSGIRFNEGPNIGFMPSVTGGIGYVLQQGKAAEMQIWCRPRVYWNFGVRGLNLPYGGIQIGISHTFKIFEK
jgi:hypothetical protein